MSDAVRPHMCDFEMLIVTSNTIVHFFIQFNGSETIDAPPSTSKYEQHGTITISACI